MNGNFNLNFDNAPKFKSPEEELEVFVGTPLEYGTYQEFGTSKMSAQPFLRPSLDLAMGKGLTIIELEGKKQFKEYLTERDQFKYRKIKWI